MARHNSEKGARIRLEKDAFKAFVRVQPSLRIYERDWRYNDEAKGVLIPVRALDEQALEQLITVLQEFGKRGDRWLIGQLNAHLAVARDPDNAVVSSLRPLESAIKAWVEKDAIRGWVFVRQANSTMQAMIVHDVAYHPPVFGKDYAQPAYVSLYLEFWGQDERHKKVFTFHDSDLSDGLTLSRLLSNIGVFHENAMMIALYDRGEKRFLEVRKQLGEQFVGTGFFEANDENRDDKYHKKTFDQDMRGVRLIVDDDCDDIENRTTTMLFRVHDESHDDDAPDDGESLEAADRFTQLPCSFDIDCFNLLSYRNGWVSVEHMKAYEYRPELREKLVLPVEHSDLIDALTADMDVLQEDIVEGKSGGTTIICQGKAGTGKTLTAEVYAEVIKRPLYRVHSGQLGTDASSIETALQKALDNATRWRAVLLIDEADVFVSQRGADLEMNAVVGVFLRTLEYYSGLLFLTTNRLDVIDDAILSRCIAQIKYKEPEVDERLRLWETLGKQYGLKLIDDKKIAQKLAERFTCTGRDIKGLIRLVTKYARQRNKRVAFDDFERMAVFKGL